MIRKSTKKRKMNTRIAITVKEHSPHEMLVADHFRRCSKITVYEVDQHKKIIKEGSYQIL